MSALAAYSCLIRKSGSSTTLSGEPCSAFVGVTSYQITSAAHRVIDPEALFHFKDGSSTVAFTNILALDYMNGRVDFSSAPTGSITFNGNYLPITTSSDLVLDSRKFTLSQSKDLVDSTVFTGTTAVSARKRTAMIKDYSLDVESIATPADLISLTSVYYAGSNIVAEVNYGTGTNAFRGLYKIASIDRSAELAGILVTQIKMQAAAVFNSNGFVAGDSESSGNAVLPSTLDNYVIMAGRIDPNSSGCATMVFDGKTISSASNLDVNLWMTKIDLSTHTCVWALKIAAGVGMSGSQLQGPWITSNRTTGDVYAAYSSGDGGARSQYFYDVSSSTQEKAAILSNNGSQPYVIKYDKDGVFQWVRTIRDGTTDQGTSKQSYLTDQSISVLSTGNVVVAGFMLHSGTATVCWSAGTTQLGQIAVLAAPAANTYESFLAEFDSAGSLVRGKSITVATTPSQHDIFGLTISTKADYGFTWDYTMRGATAASFRFQIGAGESADGTHIGDTLQTVRADDLQDRTQLAKYDSTSLVRWIADVTEQPTGSSGNFISTPNSRSELDSSGNVYTLGNFPSTSTPAKVTVRSNGWTAPTAEVIHQFNKGNQPFWCKRDDAGAVVWAKGLGSASTLNGGDAYFDAIHLANDYLWLHGRAKTNSLLVFDQGLGSQVIIDSTSTPTGFIIKCNPSDGTVVTAKTFRWQQNGGDVNGGRLYPIDTSRLALTVAEIQGSATLTYGQGETNQTHLSSGGNTSQTRTGLAIFTTNGELNFARVVPSSQSDQTLAKATSITATKV